MSAILINEIYAFGSNYILACSCSEQFILTGVVFRGNLLIAEHNTAHTALNNINIILLVQVDHACVEYTPVMEFVQLLPDWLLWVRGMGLAYFSYTVHAGI